MSLAPIGTQSLLQYLASQASAGSTDPILRALAGTNASGAAVGPSASTPAGDTVAISQQALALFEAEVAAGDTSLSSLNADGASASLLAGSTPVGATPSASAAAALRLTAAQAADVGASIKARQPALFKQFDTNGDGKLTGSELEGGLAAMEQQAEQTLWSTGTGSDSPPPLI
jgi:hypothetical protein